MLIQAHAQIEEQPSAPVLLVGGENWHQGVLGLVANSLVEKYHRPAVVASVHRASSLCTGSIRSTSGFNCIEALQRFAGSFVRCGGHVQAAGFTIEHISLASLHQHLLQEWEQQTHLQEKQPSFSQKTIDLELVSAKILTASFYARIRSLAPFGCQFEEPAFLLRRVRCLQVSRTSWGAQTFLLASLDGTWRTRGYLAGTDEVTVHPGAVVTVIFALDSPMESKQNPRLRLFFIQEEVWA